MLVQAQEKFDALLNLFGRHDELGMTLPKELENQVNRYFEIYCEVPSHLKGLEQEYVTLTRYLQMLEMKMNDSDIMRSFDGTNNVFEIYSFDFKQIYRSHSFLSFTTYPLITLMLKSNFELYEREESFVPMLQEQLGQFLKTMKPMRLNVPTHKVWEKSETEDANTRYHWLMTLGSVAPVYDLSGNPAAFFISHKTAQVFRSPFVKLVNNHVS